MKVWRLELSLWVACSLLFSMDLPAAPSWLEWSAPPECPGSDYIEDRLRDWLGGEFSAEEELRVKASVRWTEDMWQVTTRLQFRGEEGERKVDVATCSEAADFVALSIALAVEPELREQGAVDSPKNGVSPIESEESRESDVVEISSDETADSRTKVASVAKKEQDSAAGVPSRWGSLALSMVTAWGVLPELSWGPNAEFAYRFSGYRASLGITYLLPHSVDLGGINPVSSSLLTGHLEGCYLLGVLGESFEAGPCLGLQLGTIFAGEEAASEPVEFHVGFWAALSGGVRADWRWTGRLSGIVGVDMLIPLGPSDFVLSNGDTVFTPGLGFQAKLGVRISF